MYIDKEALNLEYALDIFKGTCLLNNYKFALGNSNREDMFDSLKEDGKYFYYSIDKKPLLGVLIKGALNVYEKCELINIAVKSLNNMGIYDFSVSINTNDENLIENLESIDIGVDSADIEENTFEISIDKRTVVKGKIENNDGHFYIDYEAIKKYLSNNETNEIDLYVYPEDKESFSDALVISTNLKDAGFRVQVDYSLKKLHEENLNSAFLIRFDKDDIKKYEVHYKDLKTKEEKIVMIDNIIEELSFF